MADLPLLMKQWAPVTRLGISAAALSLNHATADPTTYANGEVSKRLGSVEVPVSPIIVAFPSSGTTHVRSYVMCVLFHEYSYWPAYLLVLRFEGIIVFR